jgi:hypothetical protein
MEIIKFDDELIKSLLVGHGLAIFHFGHKSNEKNVAVEKTQ